MNEEATVSFNFEVSAADNERLNAILPHGTKRHTFRKLLSAFIESCEADSVIAHYVQRGEVEIVQKRDN